MHSPWTQLLLISADYRLAPVAIREKLSWHAGSPRPEAALRASGAVQEAVWLETCDRVEAILWVNAEGPAFDALTAWWWRENRIEMENQDNFLEFYRGLGAAQHLTRILCGVDTAFPHHEHIRRAFLRAWRFAQAQSYIGAHLEHCFRNVFGNAVRCGHEFGRTIPAAADSAQVAAVLELTERHLGPLEHRRALVAGAGPLGAAIGDRFQAAGVQISVYDPSRLSDPGARLAPDRNRFLSEFADADVAVIAARAASPLLTADDLAAMPGPARPGRFPPLVLDFSFPRAVEAGTSAWIIRLYDVDQIATRARTAGIERERRTSGEIINQQVLHAEEPSAGW